MIEKLRHHMLSVIETELSMNFFLNVNALSAKDSEIGIAKY